MVLFLIMIYNIYIYRIQLRPMKHDSNDDKEKEVEIPVVKKGKCFMIRLHKFFEQSEIDKEKYQKNH